MVSNRFSRMASVASNAMGHWLAFMAALVVTLIWLAVGPLFHWSDGWNFAANSSTTVLTFLAVFLLQHSQNHDTKALHLKLDAIILALEDVDSDIAGIERRDDALFRAKAAVLEHGGAMTATQQPVTAPSPSPRSERSASVRPQQTATARPAGASRAESMTEPVKA